MIIQYISPVQPYLEEQLVLGEPLDRFQEVRGERKLVAQLSLAVLEYRVLLHQLLHSHPGRLHVATVAVIEQ